MQWLAKLSVKRPVLATVLMLLIVVIGLAGSTQLGVDRFPKVDFPTVMVTTTLAGAAPGEMETEVTQKIEEAVNSISGIDQLRSVSSEGVSMVFIQFQLERDVDVAAQEVRDKVSSVQAQLPKGIDSPIIQKMSSDAVPALYIAVSAPDKDVRELSEIADKTIRRQLETVPGVGQVKILGATKRQINVIVDLDALRAQGLTALDVQRALSLGNATSPGGRLESGPSDRTLRIRGRAETPAQLGEIVIAERDGHVVHVSDVARVEDGAERAETAALIDSKPTVLISVSKQSGSNTIAVVDALRERMGEIGPQLPAGVKLDVMRDESLTIRTSVHAVEEHLILGGLFAAIVVLLFLGNIRSTIIAAVSIPVSIIGTFALMWVQGFTMNTITLLALALSVGIVVDDAIVVLENIVRFIEEKGMKPFAAAVYATREIGLAVLATTLSLIAVFLPVAFMGGIVGRFLKSFGVTMSFAIAVSLLVSFTLTPMMSSRWLKGLRPAARSANGAHAKSILERFIDKGYKPVESLYMVALRWTMRHRWVAVVASGMALASCVPLGRAVPKGFLPKSDEARFEIIVRAPEGTSLESTAISGERVARNVRKLEGVKSTIVTVGDNAERQRNVARIYVALADPEKRKLTQDEMMARVRAEIMPAQPKDLRINVYEVGLMGDSGSQAATIAYTLSGPDLDVLSKKSEQATQMLREIPGAVDVDTSLLVGKPEVNIRIDRERAADLGVDPGDVANALRILVGGLDVSTYEERGEVYDVHVRAHADQRLDVGSLDGIMVPSRKTGSVRLLDVVKTENDTGPSQIEHLNRQRQVRLSANAGPGFADGTIAAAFEKSARSLGLPAGYVLEPAGRTREMGKMMTGFAIAFGLSFLFMYLILAAQFESWLHPVTILFSLPLTVPFALVSLLFFKQGLDIYSMLGILVLFGVVKKNSILQIEHTNQLRAAGMERMQAILQANKDRLRPILMTTLAFVAGMVPLVTSSGIGAGFNRATAGVIVGGQTLSLVLTLLATPVMYSLFDDASAWMKKKLARFASKEDQGEDEIDDPDTLPEPRPSMPTAA